VPQQSTAIPNAFDVTDTDLSGKKHYDFDLWEKLSSYLEQERGYELVRRNFFGACKRGWRGGGGGGGK
jgi:hypothetical protein